MDTSTTAKMTAGSVTFTCYLSLLFLSSAIFFFYFKIVAETLVILGKIQFQIEWKSRSLSIRSPSIFSLGKGEKRRKASFPILSPLSLLRSFPLPFPKVSLTCFLTPHTFKNKKLFCGDERESKGLLTCLSRERRRRLFRLHQHRLSFFFLEEEEARVDAQ